MKKNQQPSYHLEWMGKPNYSKELEKIVTDILAMRADTVLDPQVDETGIMFRNPQEFFGEADAFHFQFQGQHGQPMVYAKGLCGSDGDDLDWTDTVGLVLFAIAVHSRTYADAVYSGKFGLALEDGFSLDAVYPENATMTTQKKMKQYRQWFEKKMPGTKMAGESQYA